MAIETIKVKQLAKFSVVTESGEYINWHKEIKDSDKGKVIPGGVYSVEVERNPESNKGYIKAVVSPTNTTIAAATAPTFVALPPVVDIKQLISAKPAEVKTDWATKDRSQLIGGLSHDAAELAAAAVAYNVPISSIVDQYRLALVALIKIRDEVK